MGTLRKIVFKEREKEREIKNEKNIIFKINYLKLNKKMIFRNWKSVKIKTTTFMRSLTARFWLAMMKAVNQIKLKVKELVRKLQDYVEF